MTNIFDILNINGVYSGSVPQPIKGFPLHLHNSWSVVSGDPANDRFGWEEYGSLIYINNNDIALDALLSYNLIRAESAVIKFTLVDMIDTTEITYPLFAVKAKDNQNLVGCRYNEGNFEIWKRNGGTWTSLYKGAMSLSGDHNFDVTINNTNYVVNMDGSLLKDSAHDISGDAYFGIISGRWKISGKECIRGFNVKI